MTDVTTTYLTKAGPAAPPGGGGGWQSLPPVLLQLAERRLQIVAGFVLATLLFGWLLGNLVEGQLGGEFVRVGEWGPPTFMIVASVAILILARSRRIASATLLTWALVYEVSVSVAIAFSVYFDTFASFPATLVEQDAVGYTGVALWMLGFTVIVPSQPRRAAVALLLSASATPLVYLLEVRAGRAPALGTVQFISTLVGPYLGAAILAYVAARVIYGLGQDVNRARQMGSYRLVEKLGQGGMGEVWRAEHRMLARPAAVKLIQPGSLGGSPASRTELVTRFAREAQATAQLQSPHTVEVYDFGTTEDGTFYYVMELLEGIDLERMVRQFGPLPTERVVHVLRQACHSLAEAHHRGLVHRDIKPANIVLCRRGLECDFVKVLDFGLVKHRSEPVPDRPRLTQAGAVHGTPAYLAPEIASGDDVVDGRADLYALGCVAFWLLTGHLVFEKTSYPALLLAHATLPAPAPSARTHQDVPTALDAAVQTCLAKDPADRFPSAAALDATLAAIDLASPWSAARAANWWETHGRLPQQR